MLYFKYTKSRETQIYPLCRLCDIHVLLFILNVNYFKDIVEYLYN